MTEIPYQRVVDAGFTSNQVAKWFDLAKVSLINSPAENQTNSILLRALANLK